MRIPDEVGIRRDDRHSWPWLHNGNDVVGKNGRELRAKDETCKPRFGPCLEHSSSVVAEKEKSTTQCSSRACAVSLESAGPAPLVPLPRSCMDGRRAGGRLQLPGGERLITAKLLGGFGCESRERDQG